MRLRWHPLPRIGVLSERALVGHRSSLWAILGGNFSDMLSNKPGRVTEAEDAINLALSALKGRTNEL